MKRLKIKSHVMESQITSLVWPCLSLTAKQPTVNHMTFLNDSFSKQSENAKTFAKAYLRFFVPVSVKKKCLDN